MTEPSRSFLGVLAEHRWPSRQSVQSISDSGSLQKQLVLVDLQVVTVGDGPVEPLPGGQQWRSLFDLAGYTVEGVSADRPARSLRLWRGALPECRDGWSWTDDRDLAGWFAARPHNGGRGQVWTSDVEPARMLAKISDQRPGESEYVVDARGLKVLEDSLRTTGKIIL